MPELDVMKESNAANFDKICRFEAAKLASTHFAADFSEHMKNIKTMYDWLKGLKSEVKMEAKTDE